MIVRALLALGLTLAGCRSVPVPPAPSGPSLEAKAEAFERDLASHLSPEGLLVYRLDPRIDVAAGRYGELADGAIWTGCLLAAETLRHSVTGAPEASARAARAVHALLLLERVTGVPGFYARSFNREGPGGTLLWKGDVSRDQYAGIVFGLAAAWRLHPEAGLRRRVAGAAERIARHLIEHDFRLTGPDGEVTTYGDLRGTMFGVPIGVNALISLAALGLALEATGAPEFRAALDRCDRRGWFEAARWAHVEVLGITNYNNVNMAFLAISALLGMRADPRLRAAALATLERSYAAVAGEGNALADAVWLGERPRDDRALEDARRTLERFPLDRRARPVDLRGRPEFPRRLLPDRKGVPRSSVPIPPDLRPASAFLWKSDPHLLVGNQAPGSERRKYSGCDYLLAYWMLRSRGFLEEVER